ncbi:glycosyltransferase [Aquiflexum sp. TKW24L]|uniref:glycosyltransferase n=1 Tax=Aquiflexum sp. TKW24L TaxID=2942212 RepID=UPI0020C09418|nr:glycosyltransferase [Aquiflexum sp. TKW24L]MCL6261242.1 glycosyltransferase [Aquiflexum sp. TKW24L]
MVDFSIIVFTYNPNIVIIRKVLDAVHKLQIPEDCKVEYIISDNNSKNGWKDIVIDEYAALLPSLQVLNTEKKGKVQSILNGYALCKGNYIVSIDDDNVIQSDYLLRLHELIKLYPQVWVWGPGTIQVKFVSDVPYWVSSQRWLFQEKAHTEVEFGNVQYWTSYYPSGTGFILKNEVAKLYLEKVKSGVMTSTHRSGESLASGEDSQIVYCALLMGYSAGVAPQLVLNHWTENEKANIQYCRKLVFGVFSCWKFHIQVFKDCIVHIPYDGYRKTNLFLIRELLKRRLNLRHPYFQLKLARKMADAYSYYECHDLKLPYLYKKLIQWYHLK